MPSQVPGVRRPAGVSTIARPLPLPHGTSRPTGARKYRVSDNPILRSGPGLPPKGFLDGNNSIDEWFIWWSLNILLGPPREGKWTYQVRIAPQLPGGIKPDFLITYRHPYIVLRVQSDRYHLMADSFRQGYDREQRIQLERMGYSVIDVFPQHYIRDKSGQTAIIIVREALQGRQRPDPNPTRTSTARA